MDRYMDKCHCVMANIECVTPLSLSWSQSDDTDATTANEDEALHQQPNNTRHTAPGGGGGGGPKTPREVSLSDKARYGHHTHTVSFSQTRGSSVTVPMTSGCDWSGRSCTRRSCVSSSRSSSSSTRSARDCWRSRARSRTCSGLAPTCR